MIGLPFAMIAASVDGWKRQLLLGAVLLPLWTSLLVRTAAWFILLQDRGLINSVLMQLGVTSGPVPLIFNRAGVIIAMTHVLLPFMVLPIFSVLIGIPKNLMPAAASLGAHPVRAFLNVLLPLALRGVVSGSLLVFMSALGYYITPALDRRCEGSDDQFGNRLLRHGRSQLGHGRGAWTGPPGGHDDPLCDLSSGFRQNGKRVRERVAFFETDLRFCDRLLSDRTADCDPAARFHRQCLPQLSHSRLLNPMVR